MFNNFKFWLFHARFYIGYHKQKPSGHKLFSTYHVYYDGDNYALWLGNFSIEVSA